MGASGSKVYVLFSGFSLIFLHEFGSRYQLYLDGTGNVVEDCGGERMKKAAKCLETRYGESPFFSKLMTFLLDKKWQLFTLCCRNPGGAPIVLLTIITNKGDAECIESGLSYLHKAYSLQYPDFPFTLKGVMLDQCAAELLALVHAFTEKKSTRDYIICCIRALLHNPSSRDPAQLIRFCWCSWHQMRSLCARVWSTKQHFPYAQKYDYKRNILRCIIVRWYMLICTADNLVECITRCIAMGGLFACKEMKIVHDLHDVNSGPQVDWTACNTEIQQCIDQVLNEVVRLEDGKVDDTLLKDLLHRLSESTKGGMSKDGILLDFNKIVGSQRGFQLSIVEGDPSPLTQKACGDDFADSKVHLYHMLWIPPPYSCGY
jgi:hypothetical protein